MLERDGVRRAELVGVLSLASDLGMGQPLEHGLRGCLVAMRLARVLGAGDATLAQTFAVALLRVVGCTAESHAAAAFFDDELVARAVSTPLVYAGLPESMLAMVKVIGGRSGAERAATSARLLATGPRRSREGAAAHCEVARLAAQAAARCALPQQDVDMLRRAGLLHDLGRVAVSVHLWDKAAPLSRDEEEKARLHPYFTERVLTRPAALRDIGRLASLHHERLDASGYHRSIGADGLSPLGRLLGAADVYSAMTETRAYRPGHSPEAAARMLRAEVRAGRLDGAAVEAVLASAGRRAAPRSFSESERPAGLSDREMEVLRLLASGMTTRQIGRALGITPKTADSHIQHIYTKAGVSTRAAATLFAVQHGLQPAR